MKTIMTNQIAGYHFTGATLRNGEPIPKVGEWLIHKGEIIPCSSGLHASAKVLDALQYAPGAMLHKDELAALSPRQIGLFDDLVTPPADKEP